MGMRKFVDSVDEAVRNDTEPESGSEAFWYIAGGGLAFAAGVGLNESGTDVLNETSNPRVMALYFVASLLVFAGALLVMMGVGYFLGVGKSRVRGTGPLFDVFKVVSWVVLAGLYIVVFVMGLSAFLTGLLLVYHGLVGFFASP